MNAYANKFPRMENLPPVVSKRDWKLVSLDRTCLACPSQWEAEDEFGRSVYIRYRGGYFSVGISDHGQEAAVTDGRLSPLIYHDLQEPFGGSMHDMDMLHLISEYFNVDSWVLVLGA